MTTTAEAVRRHTGPALFSFGFRPFFLFSAAWAAVAVPIWILALVLGDGTVGGADGRLWHAHEMLFGFLPGVVAGFLLTAVPNWTGRMPVTGTRLMLLFGLWAAGRMAGLAAHAIGPAAAVIDAAFLLVFAAQVWREVLAGKNMKNVPVCALVTLLAAANIGFHLGAHAVSQRLALAATAALIALIGGRIVPSFTHNWMAQQRLAPLPTPFNLFDKIVTAVVAAALTAWVVFPEHAATGAALVAAGVASAARMLRWRGWKTGAEALVWILHVGSAWLAVALTLIGLGVLAPDLVPWSAGVHALTAGGIGVMTLAVMTRASLGHTGRERRADRKTLLVYLLAIAAAVVRLAAAFLVDAYVVLLVVSAGLWFAAFAGFALAYGPMLSTPRAPAGR